MFKAGIAAENLGRINREKRERRGEDDIQPVRSTSHLVSASTAFRRR